LIINGLQRLVGIQGPGYNVTEFKGGTAEVAVPVLHSPDRGEG
jgi:hypothetical protein